MLFRFIKLLSRRIVAARLLNELVHQPTGEVDPSLIAFLDR
jgi:hypothetical protein